MAGNRWETCEPDFFGCRTLFLASLDVETVFGIDQDVVHGHIVAALLEGMRDLKGSASFKNFTTEFRCSRCIRQESVEAPG